jgi:hypothetical protein
MKTQIRKIALAAVIGLSTLVPHTGFAQNEQDPYYEAQYGTDQYSNTDDQQQPYVAPEDQQVTTQTFYTQLAPYGSWVWYGNYGYVWVPNAGSNFVPYSTAGHWVYTDYGWTWASDYQWGWAPFHYGRWTYDGYYGWVWLPGTEWAPAWVMWRNTPGYYGWAPLGFGMELTDGYYGDYGIPVSYWVFVGAEYITSEWLEDYYEPRYSCENLYRGSTVICRTDYDDNRSVRYSCGPDRNEVQKAVTAPIAVVSLRPSAVTGPKANISSMHISRPVANTYASNTVRTSPVRTSSTTMGPQHTANNYSNNVRPTVSTSYQRPSYTQPSTSGYQDPATSNGYTQPASTSYQRPIYTQPSTSGYSRPQTSSGYTQPSTTGYQRPAYTQPTYSNSTRPQATYTAPSYNSGGGSTEVHSVPARTYSGSRPAPTEVRGNRGTASYHR